ncbi:NAD-dependent epimerase/dehydratase family protein [Lunatibacter salilacus]|uniref:NAD-dependent epimerase/dehydratase family protein n=1 Tax=Lunatibacter salilacus TaxID=2483804 RepID=UPI00131AD5E0|nr:NAD-dependent epimerase/dehydratase family protein [Lunatibacter salilacus]
MKILITGITGLLGSYLARELQGVGEIHGLRRVSSTFELLGDLENQIQWHIGDITDYESLEEAFEGMDFIIHCAGLVSFSSKDSKKLLAVNTQGTANVVNVMLDKGIKRLAFISSVAALGRDAEMSVINENYKWVTSDLNTPYGISKHMAELEVWRGSQEGLEVMVFNPSIILGKVNDDRSSAAIYQYVLQEKDYYPLGSINYIDIRDTVKLIRSLMDKAPWNERYILNAATISYRQFFENMATVFQKKAPDKKLSAGILNLALVWTKITSLFRKTLLPLNRQTAQVAQLNISFDNGKVQSILKHNYIPLQETLAWAIRNEKKHQTV